MARRTADGPSALASSPEPFSQRTVIRGWAVAFGAWTVVTSAVNLLAPGDPTDVWFTVMTMAPMVVVPALFFVAYRRRPRLRATMLALDFSAITMVGLGRFAGLAMLILAVAGVMSPTFALWSGGIDVIVAFGAIPVAYLVVVRPEPPRRLLRAWIVLGLLDFAVAAPLGLITSPNGMRLIFDGPSSALIWTFPLSFIPMAGVPFSTILQITALLQLRTGRPLLRHALVHRQHDPSVLAG